jgi:hypothetical protein
MKAKTPDLLQKFCDGLGVRIQIYQVVWNPTDKAWYLWFVPDDKGQDIPSGEIKETKP